MMPDLDGDGISEILFLEGHDATYYQGLNHVYNVSTDGSLIGQWQGSANGWFPSETVINDITSDGIKEVVLSDANNNTVSIIDGSTFKTLQESTGAGIILGAADYDGNGRDEIIGFDPNSQKIIILDSNLSFIDSYNIGALAASDIGYKNRFVISDVTGDGNLELIIGGSNGLYVLTALNDKCPDDPDKIEPGICGCGVADIDSDNDGTPNCLDNCPDDPNKTEPGICGCGVEDTDSDGDGYLSCKGDCDDHNPDIHPGASDIICDGLDNDCNGIGDDGYVPSLTSCGLGVCSSTGQNICRDGQVVNTCTAGKPTGNDDNCNGIDENCNGTADENYKATQTSCGLGACTNTGQLICTNGSTQDTCTPGIPSAEVCDGIDNNCNGFVDENYVFGGFQRPINVDGSSIFKLGSTIPVKIALRDCSAQSISTATVTIAVYKISSAILGTELEEVVDSSGNANTGNLFRYDTTAGQYIFNLSTKSYTTGTYSVSAKTDHDDSYSVNFSLK